MVVARPVAADDIALGTVITFQLASGQPAVATHRVVAIARRPDGELRFLTKGDANNDPDQQWVRPEQVRGALWYAVPRLGLLSELLTGEQRQRGVEAVAAVLLGYAALWPPAPPGTGAGQERRERAGTGAGGARARRGARARPGRHRGPLDHVGFHPAPRSNMMPCSFDVAGTAPNSPPSLLPARNDRGAHIPDYR